MVGLLLAAIFALSKNSANSNITVPVTGAPSNLRQVPLMVTLVPLGVVKTKLGLLELKCAYIFSDVNASSNNALSFSEVVGAGVSDMIVSTSSHCHKNPEKMRPSKSVLIDFIIFSIKN